MKIMVVGSWRDQPDGDDDFRAACEELGAEIAAGSHTLISCSTSPRTADYHVIRGMGRTPGLHRVMRFRPDPRYAPDEWTATAESLPASLANLSVEVHQVAGSWRLTHLRAISAADLVIALAGSERGTGNAIYSAEFVGRPVAVVTGFGGAAEASWADFRRFYTQPEQAVLNRRWAADSGWARDLLNAAVVMAKRNPFAPTSRRTAAVSLLLAAGSIGAWLLLFSLPALDAVPPLARAFLLVALAVKVGWLLGTRGSFGSYAGVDRLRAAFETLAIAFAVILVGEAASVFLTGQSLAFDESDLLDAAWRLSLIGFFAGLTKDFYLATLERRGRELLGRQ